MFNNNKHTNNNQDADDNSRPIDELRNQFLDFYSKASVAEHAGDKLTAVNLYLAAYELAKNVNEDALQNSLVGVKKAWSLVLEMKNRPLAEHIFEIFSKHLPENVLADYSDDLHNLMLDKLEGLGLPMNQLANDENAKDALGKMKNLISSLNDEIQNVDTDKSDNKLAENKNNIQNTQPAKPASNKAEDDKDSYFVRREVNKYKNLVGYDNAIAYMKQKGIVSSGERDQYKQLIDRLNKEHGLNRISFSKTLIFQSPSREDANIFMEATAAEIGMPCIQMHMDDNIHGSSVLCMMAPADSNFKLNPGRTGFNGKGILMLEDIDTWDFPEPSDFGGDDGIASIFSAQMSRGVAEVVNLIEIALEDPNILVVATVGGQVSDGELRKLFTGCEFIKIWIDYPTDQERAAIWSRLAKDHPSLRAFSIQKLVNYSRNMSRYDIEVAVHEALEDAYRQGLKKRQYIPLSILNIVEKLADHQPLDSTEYKTLENVALEDFKKDLGNINDLLK